MKPEKFPFLLFLFVFGLSLQSFGQNTRQQLIWHGYFFTIPIDSRWYNVTEIQERHLIRPFAQSQFLIRTRFHRTWSKSWDTSIGLSAFFHHRSRTGIDDDFNWPEWRPHADLTGKLALGQIKIDQRIRGEARFYQNLDPVEQNLQPGLFLRAFRYRYRIQLTVPIAPNHLSKTLQLKLANEVMAMSGGEIQTFSFDQNRISADFSYEISQQVNLELGYIYLYQSLGKDRYLSQDILRITVRHQLGKQK